MKIFNVVLAMAVCAPLTTTSHAQRGPVREGNGGGGGGGGGNRGGNDSGGGRGGQGGDANRGGGNSGGANNGGGPRGSDGGGNSGGGNRGGGANNGGGQRGGNGGGGNRGGGANNGGGYHGGGSGGYRGPNPPRESRPGYGRGPRPRHPGYRPGHPYPTYPTYPYYPGYDSGEFYGEGSCSPEIKQKNVNVLESTVTTLLATEQFSDAKVLEDAILTIRSQQALEARIAAYCALVGVDVRVPQEIAEFIGARDLAPYVTRAQENLELNEEQAMVLVNSLSQNLLNNLNN